jgi:hypothetical protein
MRKIVKLLADMTIGLINNATFICVASSKVVKASKDNVVLDRGLAKKNLPMLNLLWASLVRG